MAESGFAGAGCIYFNEEIDGVSQGWAEAGNAPTFLIKENSEKIDRKSTCDDNFGAALDTLVTHLPADVEISLDGINSDNLAKIFMATLSGIDVTAGTVTDEVVLAPVKLDSSLQVASGNISALVLTDSTGVTTYVLNTDYTIESVRLGLVNILSTGSITASQSLLVDYAFAGVTGKKLSGGLKSNVTLAILFDGVNRVTGKRVMVLVKKAVLTAAEGLDFYDPNFAVLKLSGTANVPAGETVPYEVDNELVLA